MHGNFPEAAGGRDEDPVSQAAARWLARRDRGLTPAEVAELDRWRAADPRHVPELMRLEEAWRNFDRAKNVPELVDLAQKVERATARFSPRRKPAWTVPLAAAAAVALAAATAWWRWAAPAADERRAEAPSYQVLASGAQRTTLADGSVAEVRGDGEVQAEFTAGTRQVRLVQGEAHFTVTKDPDRPFIVSAGGVAIRAVGTAFNVRMAPGNVEVLVTEGTVQVAGVGQPIGAAPAGSAASLLVAGQRAVVGREVTLGAPPRIAITPAAPAEIEETLAWQGPRLVFSRTPLADAAEAFNRHATGSSRSRLVLGDPALRLKQMGGTFRAANVEGFVRLLEQTEEVKAERRGGDIILLPAR